ncbi:hypothetical protein [Pseudomonas sp. A-R-19]|uniref:hypothetical protein n=1 Tax=Pseudomonas sp. A-R-19 TaxID=2832403 RepID=UPI001CBAA86B|nr:hypothetical protein [Pseudomonas sp. A-R-19]
MKLHEAKTYVPSIVDLILCFSGILCICTGVFYLITGKIELATTGLGSGLLLLFAATIDRFESLKGLGLEAKTRELKETITEATETLVQLRQLAEISGRTLNSLVAKVRISFSVKDAHEIAQEIKKNLTDLKSEESSIVRALRPWVQGLCSELGQRLAIDFVNDYRTVGLSIETQITDMPYTAEAANPEREALIQYRETIERHSNKSYEAEKWPAEELLANLRNHVSTAPGANAEMKARNLALIESWAEEVNYLLKFSDLKTPQLWTDKFFR